MGTWLCLFYMQVHLKPDSKFSAFGFLFFFFYQCAAEIKYKLIISGTDLDETVKRMGLCIYVCIYKHAKVKTIMNERV